MTRSQLIGVSLAADILDVLVVGQLPVISWVIDIPVILMHLKFAGAKGFWTILELVPVVGTLPLFTVAAFTHENSE